MESLERDLKAVEVSYVDNMLTLQVERGFIRRLLENAKVLRFLNANHRDTISELESHRRSGDGVSVLVPSGVQRSHIEVGEACNSKTRLHPPASSWNTPG